MWTHKKYKTTFTSSYKEAGGDRVFQLTNGKVTKSFESWQAAKREGWSKV
jgi:hypothetical protein